MAGRNRNTDKSNTSTEVPKEDTVSTTAPEAPASTDTNTEPTAEAQTSEAPKAEDKPIDLTAFEAAVEKAVNDTEARDATTGELPPVLLEPVNAEFRKLEGAKAKRKARDLVNGKMKEAMKTMDIAKMPLARSYMAISENLSASGGSSSGSTAKAPADPTDAYVQRVVGLRLANEIAQAVPEGVSENWTTKANELYAEAKPQVEQYTAWLNNTAEDKGDEPNVSQVVKSAVKLAQGKAAKVGGGARSGGATGDGVRRDVGKHIESAFANVESGAFLSIAQIKAHKSEEYGDNPVSAGAISARLFPASGKPTTVPGVRAGQDANNKKGAFKL